MKLPGHPVRTGQARRGFPGRKYRFNCAPWPRLSSFGGTGHLPAKSFYQGLLNTNALIFSSSSIFESPCQPGRSLLKLIRMPRSNNGSIMTMPGPVILKKRPSRIITSLSSSLSKASNKARQARFANWRIHLRSVWFREMTGKPWYERFGTEMVTNFTTMI